MTGDVFAPRLSPRRRRLQVVAVVLAALLVLAIIIPGSLKTLLATHPSALNGTATPVAIPTAIVINTDVTYGKLMVNGKATAFDLNNSINGVTLTTLQNDLTLTAPPFNAIKCHVDISKLYRPSNQGHCHLSGSINGFYDLDMYFTLDDLTAGQQQQLLQVYQSEIDQLNQISEMIPTGQHYATGHSNQEVLTTTSAQTPLRAQFVVTPQTSNSTNSSNACSTILCPQALSLPPETNVLNYFAESASITVGWQYYHDSGSNGATNGATFFTLQSKFALNFYYDAAHGWSLIDDPTNGIPTPDVRQQLANSLCHSGLSALPPTGTSDFNINISNLDVLPGCLLSITPSGPAGRPPTAVNPITDTQTLWILIHFGAVLAVNDLAQKLWPQLPRATPDEVQAIMNASQN